MTSVSIIVGYYGDKDRWGPLAQRALASARAQSVEAEVIEMYADTLAGARNAGAKEASGDHLIFLDADDTLDHRYVEAMLTGTAALRQPATLGVYPDNSEDGEKVNIRPHPSIRIQNWLVIGTMVPADLFWEAEGFFEERAWEDWSLFTRCFALGATWEPIPEAIYRVSVNPYGRNNVERPAELFKEILGANDRWANARGLVIS